MLSIYITTYNTDLSVLMQKCNKMLKNTYPAVNTGTHVKYPDCVDVLLWVHMNPA